MFPEPLDQARSANDPSGVLQPLWLDPTKDSRDAITAAHKFIICPVVAGFTLPAKTWGTKHCLTRVARKQFANSEQSRHMWGTSKAWHRKKSLNRSLVVKS